MCRPVIVHRPRHQCIPASRNQAFVHQSVEAPLQPPLGSTGDKTHKAGKGNFRNLTAITRNQKMDMHAHTTRIS